MFAFPDNLLVIVDLEYMKFDFEEIVEIGAVKVTSDLVVIDRFSSLVCPPSFFKYDGICEAVTGIKREEIESAPMWGSVWRKFAEFCEWRKGRLLGWHIYNDLKVLREHYNYIGTGFPHNSFVVDIAAMCYFLFAYLGVKTNFKLENVCNRLQLPAPKHRALPDAMTAFHILERIQDFERSILGVPNESGRQYSSGSEVDEL